MIQQVIAVYHQGALYVREMHMNGQFEVLCEPLSNMRILLITASASEHVLYIKRYARTLKDHVRATIARTSFYRISPRITIKCVKGTNMTQ